MKPNTRPFINPSHFSRNIPQLLIFNATTHAECRDSALIEVGELGANSMILRVPMKLCNAGQRLLIHIVNEKQAKRIGKHTPIDTEIDGAVSIIALVKSVSDTSSNGMNVELQFTQFVEKDWNDFVSQWEKIQKQTLELMREIQE